MIIACTAAGKTYRELLRLATTGMIPQERDARARIESGSMWTRASSLGSPLAPAVNLIC